MGYVNGYKVEYIDKYIELYWNASEQEMYLLSETGKHFLVQRKYVVVVEDKMYKVNVALALQELILSEA